MNQQSQDEGLTKARMSVQSSAKNIIEKTPPIKQEPNNTSSDDVFKKFNSKKKKLNSQTLNTNTVTTKKRKKTIEINSMKSKNVSKIHQKLLKNEFDPDGKNSSNSTSRVFNLILINSRTTSSIMMISIELLSFIFLTGLIFSQDLVHKFAEVRKANNSIINNSLKFGSVINSIGGFLDPKSWVRLLNFKTSLFLYTLLTFLLAFLYIRFWKFYEFNKFFQGKNNDSSPEKLKKSFSLRVMSTLFLNYDLIFLLINAVCIKTIFCQKINLNSNKSGLKTKTTNYLESSSFGKEYIENHKRYSTENMILESSWVSYINSDFQCYDTGHTLLAMESLIILIINIGLKKISSRVLRFIPNPKIVNSKLGKGDFFHDLIFSYLILGKTSVVAFDLNYGIFKILYYCNFVVLSLAYCISVRNKVFYNDFYRQIKNMKLLYLAFLSLLSVVIREFEIFDKNFELPFLIYFSLFTTLLVKLNKNLCQSSFLKLVKSTENIRKINPDDILRISYRVFRLYDFEITNFYSIEKQKIDFFNKETKLLLINLLDNHKQTCSRLECFCQNSKTFKEKNALSEFEVFRENPTLMTSLFLLEELFSNFIRNNPKRDTDGVLFTYFHFLLNYLGKVTDAHFKIHFEVSKRIREGNSRNTKKKKLRLEFDVLLDQLNIIAMENLEKSVLVMRFHLNDMKEGKEEIIQKSKNNSVRHKFNLEVYEHVKFLQIFQHTKKMVGIATDLKFMFLQSLTRKNVSLKHLADLSGKFGGYKKRVYEKLKYLRNVSQNKYSPLLNIFGHFALEVCEDKRFGKILLSKFEKYYSRMDLNKIFGKFETASYELVAMFVNAENSRDLQKIVYTSANIKKWLGFKDTELVNKHLEELIPEPVKSYHSKLFSLNIMEGGGKMFMHKKPRSLLIKTKEGHLVPFELGVRLNINQSNSIEFVGILNFNTRNTDSCVALLNKQGVITGLTKPARKLFKEGMMIQSYNLDFKNINKCFNFVAKEQVQKKDLREQYDKLLRDEKRLEAWSVYSKWIKRQKKNIIDKTGNVKSIVCRFENYILYQRNKYFRFLILEQAGNEVFNRFFSRLDFGESREEQIIREISSYIEKKENLPDYEEDEDIYFEACSIKGKEETNQGKKLVSMRDIKREKWLENRKFGVNDEEPIQIPKSFLSNFNVLSKNSANSRGQLRRPNGELTFMDSRLKPPKELYGSDRKRKSKKKSNIIKSRNKDKKKTMKTNFSKRNHVSNQKNKGLVKKNSKIDDDKSQVSILKKLKMHEILIKISGKVKERKIKLNKRCTFIILNLAILMNILVTYYKKPLELQIVKDIKAHAYTLDVYNVLESSLNYPVFYLDILRMGKENWINLEEANKIFKKYSNGTSLIKYAEERFNFLTSSYLHTENQIDMSLRSIETLSAIDYDLWVFTQINFWEVNLKNGDFEKKKIPWKSAVKKIFNLGRRLAGRDYSDSGDVLRIYTPGNRSSDPTEDVFRRNLLGSLNQKMKENNLEFEEYLINLTKQNIDYNYYSTGFCLLVIFILLGVFLIYQTFVIQEKNDDLDLVLEWFKTKRNLILNILSEELDFEKNQKIFQLMKKEVRDMIDLEKVEHKKIFKVRVKHDGYRFGMKRLMYIIFFILLIVAILQSSYCLFLIPNTITARNLMKVFVLGAETSSSFSALHIFMFQTILYNNTLEGWYGESTLSTYKLIRKHIKDDILVGYHEAIGLDLGAYTDNYVQALIDSNSCENIFNYDEYHPHCDEYFNGMYRSNLINTFNTMLTVTDKLIREWEQVRGDWEKVKNILGGEHMLQIYAKLEDILRTVYYWSDIEVSNLMISELEESVDVMSIYSHFFSVISLIISIIGFRIFSRKLRECLEEFYSIFNVMPLLLIEQNMVLVHHLKKLKSKFGKFY